MFSNRKAYFTIIIANKSFIQGCPVTFNRKTYFAIIIFKKPIIQGCPVTGKPTLLSLLSTNLGYSRMFSNRKANFAIIIVNKIVKNVQ